VIYQRTNVGLDVHALSVVACAIDGQTGEVFKQRLCTDPGEILVWLRSLPGPVKVVYEAGPTGFGLCRVLVQAGVECAVVAPSKLQRPAGDRLKTDARNALHLARLLRLDEIGRDCRGYSSFGGTGSGPGSGPCPRRCSRGSDAMPTPIVETSSAPGNCLFRWCCVDRCARYVAPQPEIRPVGTAGHVRLEPRGDAAHARPPRPARCGDRRDGGGQSLHPDGAPSGMSTRNFDVDRIRVGSRDRRLATLHREHDRLVRRAGTE